MVFIGFSHFLMGYTISIRAVYSSGAALKDMDHESYKLAKMIYNNTKTLQEHMHIDFDVSVWHVLPLWTIGVPLCCNSLVIEVDAT